MVLPAASVPSMAKCIYVHQNISGIVLDTNGKRNQMEKSDAQGHYAVTSSC
jgi:hypothetical protein